MDFFTLFLLILILSIECYDVMGHPVVNFCLFCNCKEYTITFFEPMDGLGFVRLLYVSIGQI
jgi:hypothetical protein